jgi:RNA polymerase sigma factor (sigma-70 family)
VSVCADSPVDGRGSGAAALATDGAESAFTRLYAEYFDRVYRLLGRYGVTPADVEDLAQQVFSVAFAHERELEKLENPRAWLTAIAVRVAHEHYRRRRVRRLKAWLVELSWAARAEDEATPERAALQTETSTLVRSVLERMSEKLRDALVLVELEELGTREAAEVLAIPHNTLRSRQRLARAEFERLWREQERERERPR